MKRRRLSPPVAYWYLRKQDRRRAKMAADAAAAKADSEKTTADNANLTVDKD